MAAPCCPPGLPRRASTGSAFETPQAQYDHAALVVIGRPVRADGETALSGYRANVHLLDVETVLKGSGVPFDVGAPLPFKAVDSEG